MRTNENRDERPLNAKYPKTLYWPWSPSIGGDDGVHPDPSRFVGESVVVTEKLDGGNTLLHSGQVYARSVAAPSVQPAFSREPRQRVLHAEVTTGNRTPHQP